MNNGAIKKKKSLCEKSLGILVHHYFISLKGNVYKFEGYISLLTSHNLSINYGSYMNQMLIFGPIWAQNTILPFFCGPLVHFCPLIFMVEIYLTSQTYIYIFFGWKGNLKHFSQNLN